MSRINWGRCKRREQDRKVRRDEALERDALVELRDQGKTALAVRECAAILDHGALSLHREPETVREKVNGIAAWCSRTFVTRKQLSWLAKTKAILDALFRGDPMTKKTHRRQTTTVQPPLPDWMRDRSLLPKRPPGKP